ncbi:ParA family protein [Caenispirillum bisanense]|uniref:ParA family protein n=1 Tax=Caenispirillum bisanense TaxID=414052 RepID=UPI0031DFE3E6
MDLLGLAEIAALLGVSKQAVANWKARKADFPKPIAELKSGPVWSKAAIVAWADSEGLSIVEAEEDDEAEEEEEGAARRAIIAALMNMKGGVGKSTMTANVGWYAAYHRNLRVLLIDLDPQFNLSQYILGARGYEKLLDEGSPTIESIFRDSKSGNKPDSLAEVIRPVANWNDGSCIHIVPASLELAWAMRYATDRAHILRDYIDDIRDQYDLVLIDCAPTESILSTATYLATDYIFVPVKPEFLSTIGLPLLLQSIREFQNTHKNAPLPELGGIVFNDTGEKVEHDRSRDYVRGIAAENDWYVFENEVSHSDSYPAGARVGKPIFLTDNARSWKKEEFNRVAGEFLERMGV